MFSKPLRVTFLATLPPTSSTIIGRTIPLAKELNKRGHTVNIVTLGKTENTETTEVPIIIAGPCFRDGVKKPNPLQILSRYIKAKNGLKKALQEQKPDVVVLVKPHPQNFSAVKKISVPIILDADDDEAQSSRTNWLEKTWLKRINNKVAKKSGAISACSPYLVDHYKKICPNKKIELIPTAISSETTNEHLDLRRYFGINPEAQIILYLGSLALTSGHRVDQILRVWNELSADNLQLHLILAGDGIDAENIRARSHQLSNNNRIHFFGRYDNNLSEDFARQANLLIDPVDDSIGSLAKSSSRALLALKTGTPIVAGNVGIRKIILPASLHNRFLYDTNQLSSLSTAIQFGLTQEAKQLFINETEGLWHNWTWDAVGAKFSSLVEESTNSTQ